MQATKSFTSSKLAPRRACPCPIARTRLQVACRVSAVPTFTDSEKQALRAYRGNAANPGKEDALKVLKRAATFKDVPAESVEGALLAVEEATSQEDNGPTPSIAGRWRLLFGTGTKIRAFQYIPVKEDFVLDETSKTVALESSIGPFEFFIRGAMSAWRPEAGALDFQFNKVDIHLNGDKVWEVQPKTKPKTYTFFYVGPDMACARSSAGGVALLVK